MIRINLLPSGRKKAIVLPSSLIYGLIAVVVIVITIGVFTHTLNKQISTKKADIAAKQQKLKQLEIALARADVEIKYSCYCRGM